MTTPEMSQTQDIQSYTRKYTYADFKHTLRFMYSYITKRHTYDPLQKKQADKKFGFLTGSIVLLGISFMF